MIMNIAVAVAVTELFVTSREAGSPFIVFGTMLKFEGLEKRLGLGLARSWVMVSVSSRGKNQTSRTRLSLVELQEGLGLGHISNQKRNISVL